ncbi:hypothetical protein [Spirosoma montaniterrae]|uniref:SGNH hydrolase-type esterase domain-containing protein n=1 Tax=Spirosoma montaniterrae TaxID=1178516 RepID=A0A1P9X0K4_9BACT|nr:hypothetical protein [Spirosoma montaniterrae]AQG81176.1 hypothetical protein AWR27_18740 [Spirosoma montaniterrae]
MIRKAILTTVLLLLLYSTFIHVCQSHIRRTGLTTQQTNTIKAEEFAYETDHQADTIIVGSSMSNRLLFDGMQSSYCNLSMEGMASIDGLGLIAHMRQHPRLLLVEMNSLDRLPDTTLALHLTEPGWALVREYVPLTRLKYQPLGVAKALFRDWYSPPAQAMGAESIDTAFASKLIAERLHDMMRIPSEGELREKIAKVAEHIRHFQKAGTQVVFFEMPTDPRVRNAALSCRIRHVIEETFPPAAYRYIRYPVTVYQTTDGVHLPQTEGIRYSRYLYQQLCQKL